MWLLRVLFRMWLVLSVRTLCWKPVTKEAIKLKKPFEGMKLQIQVAEMSFLCGRVRLRVEEGLQTSGGSLSRVTLPSVRRSLLRWFRSVQLVEDPGVYPKHTQELYIYLICTYNTLWLHLTLFLFHVFVLFPHMYDCLPCLIWFFYFTCLVFSLSAPQSSLSLPLFMSLVLLLL